MPNIPFAGEQSLRLSYLKKQALAELPASKSEAFRQRQIYKYAEGLSIYKDFLNKFIEENFDIVDHEPGATPHRNSLAIFPTRLFAFLFSYRYFDIVERSKVRNIGERASDMSTNPGAKYGCNSPFISNAMAQFYPQIKKFQIYDKVSRTQIACFGFLQPKIDSAFLNNEITAIWKDNESGTTTHFLQPLTDVYLNILACRQSKLDKLKTPVPKTTLEAI